MSLPKDGGLSSKKPEKAAGPKPILVAAAKGTAAKSAATKKK
jgi:hypothetical protein